jgi:hypothetical protein
VIEPAVAALASLVSVAIDAQEAATDMAPSKIKVTRRDGSIVEAAGRAIPGSPAAPMTESKILEKFKDCLSFGLDCPEAEAAAFADTVLTVEEMPDMSRLIRAFPSSR